ncbi:CAP domain-containing protein [Pseudalkalibacillus berkeleyi]|uniref:CAP domain-containing protein n=1 Tax=Pseudalkalibacillus berkeleyi TaxID=1069813 RepID=A0ABS9GXL5_9BACL|nr:CAP domain-containing protein [Pseudalkalibacillus berkeleyi]MCF6136267.1 CAP domain-containing protein [Pseudalkalibacillus berkeleyi]
MIKKILVTSLLSASILGASAGVSEASTNNTDAQVHVYKQYGQVQIDQEQLNSFIQDILNKNNIQLDASIQEKLQKALNQGDAQQSEPQKEEPKAEQPKAEEPKAEQPAPKQDAEKPQVKQPEQKQEKAQEPAQQQEATPQPTQKSEQANKQETTSEAEFQLTADEQQMLDLVNQERQKAGVAPLKADPELTKMARVKSQDMIDNNYFDHNSPTYGSPFDMMDQFGIEYQTAGENIAGNSSVQGAHTSLMNSDGHRKNILGSQYTKIGIGIVDGGPYGKMFTQAFTG